MPVKVNAITSRHSRFETVMIFLVTSFLLIFPKGGIKISGVPITWGYVLLFGVAAFFFLTSLIEGINISRRRWLVIFACLPFQVYLLMIIAAHGFVSAGFMISMVVNVIVLPWVLVVFYGNYFDTFDPRFMLNLIRHGVFIVAAYGIFLFFYRALTGNLIEIPFLTMNYGDLGTMDAKFNLRFGFLPKLFSTYNNGNIFGVCMIMMLPLFDRLEKSRWKTAVVKLALVLSLSRTVWIGLFVYEFFMQLYLNKITLKLLTRNLILLAGIAGAILFVVFVVLGGDSAFLFDTNLGGRADQLEVLDHITLLSHIPFISIAEVVYLSILERMGLAGLALFLLMVGAPVALSLPSRNSIKKSFIAGVLLYLFLALSDGAIMFIPVMAFFWFLVSMMVSSNEYFDRPETTEASS